MPMSVSIIYRRSRQHMPTYTINLIDLLAVSALVCSLINRGESMRDAVVAGFTFNVVYVYITHI